jgi:hypothetical protein
MDRPAHEADFIHVVLGHCCGLDLRTEPLDSDRRVVHQSGIHFAVDAASNEASQSELG